MKTKMENQSSLLKMVFINMLATNIAIMQFQMTLTSKEEEKKGLKDFIKKSKKAIRIVTDVKHYEILVDLYNSFVNGKETYFMLLAKTIDNKDTIAKWDKTEKGFKEFIKAREEAVAKSKEEYEQRIAQQEIIRKAREEGKKIEMVYKNGKIVPVVVEEKLQN